MLIIQQVDGNILYPRIVGGVMKSPSHYHHGALALIHQYLWRSRDDCAGNPTYSSSKKSPNSYNLYDNHKEAQQQKKNEEFGIINK